MPHLTELAHHFVLAATTGNSDLAIDYARRAASAAVDQLAYEEGVRLYTLALGVLDLAPAPDLGRRCDLLLGCADAAVRSGDLAAADTAAAAALASARLLQDPERLAGAVLVRGERWGATMDARIMAP